MSLFFDFLNSHGSITQMIHLSHFWRRAKNMWAWLLDLHLDRLQWASWVIFSKPSLPKGEYLHVWYLQIVLVMSCRACSGHGQPGAVMSSDTDRQALGAINKALSFLFCTSRVTASAPADFRWHLCKMTIAKPLFFFFFFLWIAISPET